MFSIRLSLSYNKDNILLLDNSTVYLDFKHKNLFLNSLFTLENQFQILFFTNDEEERDFYKRAGKNIIYLKE